MVSPCGKYSCFLCEFDPDYFTNMWGYWRSQLAMYRVEWDPDLVF